ncbi:MAG: glycine cleavage system protein GcvH [Pseudobacteriovorax sp.]|nr:glycine cleavage system protein GcvH [Pseudobacteriovorax sp.]
MPYPSDLKYTKDHEWLRIDGDTAIIGITDYALEQLGDVVHVELPSEGEEFEAGSTFGTIESTKTVSDLYMPATGKISAVNSDIEDQLETLAESPYDKGWLVKISISSLGDDLISAEEYETFISEDE